MMNCPKLGKQTKSAMQPAVQLVLLVALLCEGVSGQTNADRPFIATQEQPGEADSANGLRWWKGNLHTHSLWSDGDDFPEMIADWYSENGYNFLALSDHNILSDGMRWMDVDAIFKRAHPAVIEDYRKRFGNAWVEMRTTEDGEQVRLKPLDEFSPLLEKAGQFLMIPGEEISDRAEGKPVHMNATNLRDLIEPVGGATVRESMANNLRAVLEQEKRTGREIMAHLNHPNFGWAVTAEDLAHVVQEQFFEVFNGHPSVEQLGDEEHISIERMWDVANAIRVVELEADPLLGIATDDSHEYHGRPGAQPGRAWVMVRAPYLTPEHIVKALKAGQFYASTGVEVSDFGYNSETRELHIDIDADPGAMYTTTFIAIMKPAEGEKLSDADIGKIVAEVEGLNPTYRCTGKEALIRARVTSSLHHSNPSIDSQKQEAWIQPYVVD